MKSFAHIPAPMIMYDINLQENRKLGFDLHRFAYVFCPSLLLLLHNKLHLTLIFLIGVAVV